MATNNSNAQRFTLIGNLGGDPEARTVPAVEKTIRVYDAILDDWIEKDISRPEINFLTFSIAVGGYNDIPLRWIHCVDWEGVCHRMRKGDSVALTGYWEHRPYFDKKTGEPKEWRQFVVETVQPRRLKVRETA